MLELLLCYLLKWQNLELTVANCNAAWPLSYVIGRFSDTTIEVLGMMDDDDNIDLELTAALIRHIAVNENVSAFPVLMFLYIWVGFFVYCCGIVSLILRHK